MTVKERIERTLDNTRGPLCDDCLAAEIGASQRQVVYQACSRLAAAGLIGRRKQACVVCGKVKIGSWNLGQGSREAITERHAGPDLVAERPWFWEGNVQGRIVFELVRSGFQIRRVANPESREPGRDIEAVGPDGRDLWISVKGFPEQSVHAQARHWFASAVFDLLLYRDENPTVQLALGLPAGFSTYENLAARVKWARRELPFLIYWVDERGEVRVDQ